MAETDSTDASADDALDSDPGAGEALLQTEVTFWRELLQAEDPELTTDCAERMRYALALAETRLAALRKLRLHTKLDCSANSIAVH